MKKTLVLILCFALICTLGLAACGQSSSSSTTEAQKPAENAAPAPAAPATTTENAAPVASEEPVMLNMMTHVNYEGIGAIIEAFEEKYPNIKVNWEIGQQVDTGIYTAVLAEKDCPDIVMLGSGATRIAPLAEAGLIENLDPYYESRGWAQHINQDIIDSLKIANGSAYEVSCGMDVFTIKYYKSDFEALGLQPPETYDEFIALMQALKDAGNVPMELGVADGVMGGHIASAMWNAIFGREGVGDMLFGDTDYTSEKSLLAISEIKKMYDNGFINKNCTEITYAEAASVFAAHGASCVLCLQGYLDQFVADGLDLNDIGSFVIPSFDADRDSTPIAGLAQCWVLPTNATNKEAALTWLDFVTSDDYIDACIKYEDRGTWNLGIGAVTPSDPSILDGIGHPLVRAAYQSLADGFGYNCSPYFPGNVKTVCFESMQNLFAGVYSPEDVVNALQAAKDEYLAG